MEAVQSGEEFLGEVYLLIPLSSYGLTSLLLDFVGFIALKVSL